MDANKLIDKYYQNHPEAKKYLLAHSRAVAKKAINITEKLEFSPEATEFVKEAAMLHDIGIYLTNAHYIDCQGKEPYICHGTLGRKILKKEGLPLHAKVAERHIGVGLTAKEIKEQNLPLPARNMTPKTTEEEIVAYADLFFSKSHKPIDQEKSIKQIKKGLAKFGERKLNIFDHWVKKYK